MKIKKIKSKLLSNQINRLSLKQYILILLSILCSEITFSQTQEVDSLLTELSSSRSDLDSIIIMNELSNELFNIDLNKALDYAQHALDLSIKTGDQELKARSLYTKGIVLYESSERPSALQYHEDSERISEELALLELQANNLMSIAKHHRYVTKDSALTVDYFLKSVEISKAANYDYGTGRSYAKLASFYTKYNQVDLCQEYLNLSSEYYLKLPTGAKTLAHYYNEVGEKIWATNPKKSMELYLKGLQYSDTPKLKASLAKAYSYIGDHDKSLQYLKEAIPFFRETEKTKRMLGIAIAQLAEVYIQLNDYQNAEKACDEGIALLDNLGRTNQRALPALLRSKGIIEEHKGNEDAALEYYTGSLSESIRIKYSFDRVKTTNILGFFYLSRDSKKAKEYCNKSLQDAHRLKFRNLEINACDCLYHIYKEENTFEDALKYHEQKVSLIDSVSTLKVEHALDINNRMAEKDKLLAQQSFQKKTRDVQLRFLFVSTFLGLLLIGILTQSLRKISRQNKEISDKTKDLLNANQSLEQSNSELERFAHIASHDLKSPLRNIISYTGLLRRNLKNEKKPIVNDSINFIESSGKIMNQLIDDILEYSKLSSTDVSDLELEHVDLNEVITEITPLILNNPQGKPINIEALDLPSIRWNYSKIFLLFKNLIENGMKYNESDKPTVKIYTIKATGSTSVFVEDNGIGIKKEYFDKVFEMFQRLHSQGEYEGTGLGLATCKKIIDEFEGEISISSQIGKGTIFKIQFPDHMIHHTTLSRIAV